MTQSEAEAIQRTCNEVLAALAAESECLHKIECYDVLVSVLHPNGPPTLKIEQSSPHAWVFKRVVADKMEQRTGRRFLIETRW